MKLEVRGPLQNRTDLIESGKSHAESMASIEQGVRFLTVQAINANVRSADIERD